MPMDTSRAPGAEHPGAQSPTDCRPEHLPDTPNPNSASRSPAFYGVTEIQMHGPLMGGGWVCLAPAQAWRERACSDRAGPRGPLISIKVRAA